MITSAAENMRVDSTSTSTSAVIWIGATNAGGFFWVNGEPFTYTNYIPGEPSGDGQCLHIAGNDTRWNDLSCTYTGPTAVVCEVP